MPAVAAAFFQFGAAARQIQFIVNHQDIFRGNLIETRHRADRLERRAEARPARNRFRSLLFAADDSHGFRVSFEAPCKGLKETTALTFVSSGMGRDGELYDSIMLDDGTHCAFAKVVPTVFD